jgi:hypothetical protein
MLPVRADKMCRWAVGGNVKFPTGKIANGPEVLSRGLRHDVQTRNCFSSLGHSPPRFINPANPPTIHCTSDMEQLSRSSFLSPSSPRSSSSLLNDEHAFALRGLPDVILVGISAAMDAARRNEMLRMKQHGGSQPGKRPSRELGREEAARRLHADFFLLEDEENPYGGTGPMFTGAEFERRLRVNARRYDRVKPESSRAFALSSE